MGRALSPLTPHASVAHFFGAELRHRRLAAGLSTRHLAPRVLASPGLLDKVERAQRFPSVDLAARCDAELHADGALTRLHGLVVAQREATRPHARRAGSAHSEVARFVEVLQAALADFATPVQREPSDGLMERIDLLLATAGPDSSPSPLKRRRR
ncbi:helix-turn-helix domain-containing protein [Hamadaea sp. NPDC051192]|uniref:helix-turn-helix domain-containing protein n=1 Tax=Hamadaea sp. NPDC051192 TaxID=3154940 RepID=UPI003436E392